MPKTGKSISLLVAHGENNTEKNAGSTIAPTDYLIQQMQSEKRGTRNTGTNTAKQLRQTI